MFVCQTVWSHPGDLQRSSTAQTWTRWELGTSNDYHEVLSQNVLGKEALSNVKILSYQHKPVRQDPHLNELKVLYSSNRDGKTTARPCRHLPKVLQRSWMHLASWMISIVILWIGHHKMLLLSHWPTWFSYLMPPLETQKNFFKYRGALSQPCDGLNQVGTWVLVHPVERCKFGMPPLRGSSATCVAIQEGSEPLPGTSTCWAVDVQMRRFINMMFESESTWCPECRHIRTWYVAWITTLKGCWHLGGMTTSCAFGRRPQQKPRAHLHRASGCCEGFEVVPLAAPCPCHWRGLSRSSDLFVECLQWQTSHVYQCRESGHRHFVGEQERELLTAHGYSRNQLSLWKYPSLVKVGDLEGHEGRLLGLAQSPDGSLVCSPSADETLRFWRVFTPASPDKALAPSNKTNTNTILKTIR